MVCIYEVQGITALWLVLITYMVCLFGIFRPLVVRVDLPLSQVCSP